MKFKILWKDREDVVLLVLGLGGVIIYTPSIPLSAILKPRPSAWGTTWRLWKSVPAGRLGRKTRTQRVAKTVVSPLPDSAYPSASPGLNPVQAGTQTRVGCWRRAQESLWSFFKDRQDGDEASSHFGSEGGTAGGRVQPQASGLSTQGSLREPERAGDPAERDGIEIVQITPRKEERTNRGKKDSWNKQKTDNKTVAMHLQTYILFWMANCLNSLTDVTEMDGKVWPNYTGSTRNSFQTNATFSSEVKGRRTYNMETNQKKAERSGSINVKQGKPQRKQKQGGSEGCLSWGQRSTHQEEVPAAWNVCAPKTRCKINRTKR